jgi:hypothetical protein
MANVFACFGGRVNFHIANVSIRTVAKMTELRKKFEESGEPEVVTYAHMVGELADILVLTYNITFDFKGDENASLTDLKDFWESWTSNKPDEKKIRHAIDWRLDTTTTVYNEWMRAVDLSQTPVREASALPDRYLTPEEVSQAKSDTPLE